MDNGFEAVKKNLRGWSFYPLKPWERENLARLFHETSAVTYGELHTLDIFLLCPEAVILFTRKVDGLFLWKVTWG